MFVGVLDVCLIRRDTKTIYKHPLAIRIPIFRHLGMSSPKPQKQILWSMRCHAETWNHRWLQLGKMGFPWLLETSFRKDTGRLEFWTLAELLPTQMFLSMYLYRSNFMVNGAVVFPRINSSVATLPTAATFESQNSSQHRRRGKVPRCQRPSAAAQRQHHGRWFLAAAFGGLDDERQCTILW